MHVFFILALSLTLFQRIYSFSFYQSTMKILRYGIHHRFQIGLPQLSLHCQLNSNARSDIKNASDKLDDYRFIFPSLHESQWEQIRKYSELLTDWNSKINIISRKDIQHIIPRHILPSLSISLVKKFKSSDCVIDVGTGGGLPGIPMAIANPETQFTLLDSNNKKITVVSDIVEKLKLKNVKVVWSRSEAVEEKFDFIIGRAVSAIPNFLDFSSHLIRSTVESCDDKISNGLLYLKGGEFSAELKEAEINTYSLRSVQDLLNIESDKYILYIPSHEIKIFNTKKKINN